jgi:hypothetical protein
MSQQQTLSPMQQELLHRADAIFASVGKAVEKAGNFAAEQIPDIALQYVAFGRAIESSYMAIGVLLFLTGLYLLVRVAVMDSRKMGITGYDTWADGRVGAVVSSIPMIIVGFMTMMINIKAFFMVWFAPKVWLILELVHLIKAVK